MENSYIGEMPTINWHKKNSEFAHFVIYMQYIYLFADRLIHSSN